MKPIKLLAVLILLASCQKETTPLKERNELSVITNKVVAIEKYAFTYTGNKKTVTLICTRTIGTLYTDYSLADKTGKIVYMSLTEDAKTAKVSNFQMPNELPFAPLLPPNMKWHTCMRNTIITCLHYYPCSQLCHREAMIGCMMGWSVACLFHKVTVTVTKI